LIPRSGRVLAAAAALLAGCGAPDREAPPAVDAPRLLLVGLDGATWDLLDPWIAEGRLPHLEGLRREGVRGPLVSNLPSLSPALWSTIATGKEPRRHGIDGFFRVTEDGTKVPVDQTMRRARAFWEILGDRGLRSCVVYWWNTWPAEPIEGVLVSDYLFYARNALQNAREVERAELLARAVYPPELAPLLARRLREASALSADVVRSIVPFDDGAMRGFLEGVESRLGETPTLNSLSVLKDKLIESEFHREIGLELTAASRFDLWVYYSKGIDATGHAFWRFFEPDAPVYANQPATPAELALYHDVIPNFYAYEDRNVGKLLERVGRDSWVLVVSDHGHHAGGHEDGPDGVILLAGPGVRRGERVEGVRIEDVAPLVLHLLGVPAGDDMDGRVPVELFTDEWLAAHPVKTVPTHERDRTIVPAERDDAVDAELMRELRALGYVD